MFKIAVLVALLASASAFTPSQFIGMFVTVDTENVDGYWRDKMKNIQPVTCFI